MPSVMLFVDGTWLYCNVPRLSTVYNRENYRVDFGKLPRVLAEQVSRQAGNAPMDVVRTFLFGSYATNYDLRDEEAVQRRRDFFDMLREEHRYEVEAFPINFRGRRLRGSDRDPQDVFEPREKCVDISLATNMLFYAAIPHAYDIAIAVVGDRDFKPVCQTVRRLGKRVALASIKGSCAPEFSDARDASHLRDFDMIWLDDLLDQLELRYEPHQLECQSSIHMGNRMVWTTFHPRKGQKFYCQECLASYAKQRTALEEEYVMRQNGQAAAPAAATAETAEAGAPATEAAETGVAETPTAEAPEPPPAEPAAAPLCGPIAHLVMERGFGFVRAPSGQDYFFHLTDLEGGVEFERLAPGMEVEFEIKREPSGGKAGAAHHVRVRSVPTDASIA